MMDTNTALANFNRERYEEYLQDIELANKALSEAVLNVADEDLICDIYAMPSGNHQTYYGKIYCLGERYSLVYAKPILNHPVYYPEEVYMYLFKDAIAVNKKDGRQMGEIVCGITYLEEGFVRNLYSKLKALPDKFVLEEDALVLDGVMHGIRVYENGHINKEVVYKDSRYIPYKGGNTAELQWYYSAFYLMIEQIIGQGAKGKRMECNCSQYESGEYLREYADYLNFYEENSDGTRYKCAYCNSFWRSDTNSPDMRLRYKKYKESED